MSNLILIAAISENNVIGNKGSVPWTISEDVKRFKRLTIDHPVIMGRKTYDSIPEKFKPLVGRTNIIVSKNPKRENYPREVLIYTSIEKAVEKAFRINNDCYVAGGGQIYQQTIDLASRLEITKIHSEYEGDVFFPNIDQEKWKEAFKESHGEYSFITYQRK